MNLSLKLSEVTYNDHDDNDIINVDELVFGEIPKDQFSVCDSLELKLITGNITSTEIS